jgi:hypothetical protein
VDPVGTVRWSLAAARPVSYPAWSTSGIRVAYLSGSSLRIVAGDGTHDHLLARHVAAVAPAWKPLRDPLPAGQVATGPGTNVLAYADRRGRVTVRDVDSGRLLLRSPPGPKPIRAPGRPTASGLSASVTPDFDAGYRFPVTASPPPVDDPRGEPRPGTHGGAAETRGNSRATSHASWSSGDRRRELPRASCSRTGPTEDLAWSPDGLLLVGWRDADQWLPASEPTAASGRAHLPAVRPRRDRQAASPASAAGAASADDWPAAQLSRAIPGGGRTRAPSPRSAARRWRAGADLAPDSPADAAQTRSLGSRLDPVDAAPLRRGSLPALAAARVAVGSGTLRDLERAEGLDLVLGEP